MTTLQTPTRTHWTGLDAPPASADRPPRTVVKASTLRRLNDYHADGSFGGTYPLPACPARHHSTRKVYFISREPTAPPDVV